MKRAKLRAVEPTAIPEEDSFSVLDLMRDVQDGQFIRVSGNELGFALDGDLILCDRARKPRRGDMAVYFSEGGKVWAEPYQGHHLKAVGDDYEDDQVWGVALTVIRQL